MTTEDDIVRFFRALPEARRREYAELVERDKRFGEDVEAERREREPTLRRKAP